MHFKEITKILKKDTFDFKYTSKNYNETEELAKCIAESLGDNDIISLNGELGSGKTVFMHGIAKYFNIEDQVYSPTFAIVNEYITNNNLKIYHFDVYRLNDEIEFLDQIGNDYFSSGICIIEWGNIIKNILPKNSINIDITKDENDENTRYIHVWRNSK